MGLWRCWLGPHICGLHGRVCGAKMGEPTKDGNPMLALTANEG